MTEVERLRLRESDLNHIGARPTVRGSLEVTGRVLIVSVRRGRVIVEVDGTRITARPGDIVSVISHCAITPEFGGTP